MYYVIKLWMPLTRFIFCNKVIGYSIYAVLWENILYCYHTNKSPAPQLQYTVISWVIDLYATKYNSRVKLTWNWKYFVIFNFNKTRTFTRGLVERNVNKMSRLVDEEPSSPWSGTRGVRCRAAVRSVRGGGRGRRRRGLQRLERRAQRRPQREARYRRLHYRHRFWERSFARFQVHL